MTEMGQAPVQAFASFSEVPTLLVPWLIVCFNGLAAVAALRTKQEGLVLVLLAWSPGFAHHGVVFTMSAEGDQYPCPLQ
jgi:hypothetical protein